MSRKRKLLIGAATLWPLLCFLAFMTVVGVFPAQPVHGHTAAARFPGGAGAFHAVFAMQSVMSVWTIGLLVFYLRDVYHNPGVDPDKRKLWAAVLLIANLAAMPAYWYWHVWRVETPTAKPPDTDWRIAARQHKP